jgi:hypothetical protein
MGVLKFYSGLTRLICFIGGIRTYVQYNPKLASFLSASRYSGDQDDFERVHHPRLPRQVDVPHQVGVDHARRRGWTLPRKRRPHGPHGMLHRKHPGELSLHALVFENAL